MIDRRQLLVALTAIGLGVGLTSMSAEAATLAQIKSRGTIRVAVPEEFPPFGSVGPDMTLQGLDIDVAKLLGAKLGVKVDLVPVLSTNRIPFLQAGRADIVISSLGKNPEREKVIDFSQPYAPFYNSVFGPDDVSVPDAAALAGKSIAVTKGSIEDLDLTKVAPQGAIIKRYEDNNGTISAFLSGQTDLMASGAVVANALMERNPARKPKLKFNLKNSPVHVGFAKGTPDLQARINEILTESKKDGSLNSLSQKWLKTDLPKDL